MGLGGHYGISEWQMGQKGDSPVRQEAHPVSGSVLMVFTGVWESAYGGRRGIFLDYGDGNHTGSQGK